MATYTNPTQQLLGSNLGMVDRTAPTSMYPIQLPSNYFSAAMGPANQSAHALALGLQPPFQAAQMLNSSPLMQRYLSPSQKEYQQQAPAAQVPWFRAIQNETYTPSYEPVPTGGGDTNKVWYTDNGMIDWAEVLRGVSFPLNKTAEQLAIERYNSDPAFKQQMIDHFSSPEGKAQIAAWAKANNFNLFPNSGAPATAQAQIAPPAPTAPIAPPAPSTSGVDVNSPAFKNAIAAWAAVNNFDLFPNRTNLGMGL